MFGEMASIDSKGSVYCSTADYIHFENGDRFYSAHQQDEKFPGGSPTYFGFLENDPPSIVENMITPTIISD